MGRRTSGLSIKRVCGEYRVYVDGRCIAQVPSRADAEDVAEGVARREADEPRDDLDYVAGNWTTRDTR